MLGERNDEGRATEQRMSERDRQRDERQRGKGLENSIGGK